MDDLSSCICIRSENGIVSRFDTLIRPKRKTWLRPFRPRARHAVSSEETKVNLVADTVDPGPLAEVYRLLVDASSRPKIKFDGTSTEKVCASGCWRFDSPVPRVKLDSR